MEGVSSMNEKQPRRAERGAMRWVRMSGRALHDLILAGAAVAFIYGTGDRVVDTIKKDIRSGDAKHAAARLAEKQKQTAGPVLGKPGLTDYTYLQVQGKDGVLQNVAVPTWDFKEDTSRIPRKTMPGQ